MRNRSRHSLHASHEEVKGANVGDVEQHIQVAERKHRLEVRSTLLLLFPIRRRLFERQQQNNHHHLAKRDACAWRIQAVHLESTHVKVQERGQQVRGRTDLESRDFDHRQQRHQLGALLGRGSAGDEGEGERCVGAADTTQHACYYQHVVAFAKGGRERPCEEVDEVAGDGDACAEDERLLERPPVAIPAEEGSRD